MIEALPMALGIALSPFPVIPAIMLLFTGRPRPTAAAFLLGWMAGVGAVAALGLLLADVFEVSGTPPLWVSWLRLLLGAVLVGYGLKLWLGRGRRTDMPPWMRSLQQATPGSAARLGALLSAANPKVALLALTGGLALVPGVAPLLGFVLVASLTVAAPLLAHLAAGDRVLGPLGRARTWLERNNDAVMAVVLVVIGALVASKGLQGL